MNVWKNIWAYFGIALLCLCAFQNIIAYNALFSKKQIHIRNTFKAEQLIDLPASTDELRVFREHSPTFQFYTLLSSIGNDQTLHASVRYGVVVFDIDFYRGRYVNKPSDTMLAACAIQPFSVPALARLPLLSPFGSDLRNCAYESYGYQYLPKRYPIRSTDNVTACRLAIERGFTHVIVIFKNTSSFEERRLNCENP